MLELNKENFEAEVLNSNIPVVVDFFANWCGPCRMLAPIMEELSAEADCFKVAKVDTDKEGGLAAQYGVQYLPTVLVFKNGKVAAKSVGVKTKQDFLEMLNA